MRLTAIAVAVVVAQGKPYGYSLFNLDAMATICQIASITGPAKAVPRRNSGRPELTSKGRRHQDDLWTFELPDGRGMCRALAFMAPFIRDKRQWPHARDVQYFDEWPMRHPALLFGGLALNRPEDVSLWKTLKADSDVEEVVRNFFVRQPLLWTND